MRCLALIILGLVLSASVSADIIRVPADQPTIQSGIDSARLNDTVLIADGTYTGPGNRDIQFRNKKISVMSENGPEYTIIDCEGAPGDPHRGFVFWGREGRETLLYGLTITNAYAENIVPFDLNHWGGAIYINDGSQPGDASPTIRRVHFVNNRCAPSNGVGAGIGGRFYASPMIDSCVFRGNSAASGSAIVLNSLLGNRTVIRHCQFYENTGRGPVVACLEAYTLISNCTFVDNASSYGTWTVSVLGPPQVTIQRTIITNNSQQAAVGSYDFANLHIECSNFRSNSRGDWVGIAAAFENTNGNISEIPFFCNPTDNDYSLYHISACLPDRNDCGVLMGALGEGCRFPYICGDADWSGEVTWADLVYLWEFYFQMGYEPFPLDAGDPNCDGIIDISDIVYLAAYLNGEGSPPCCFEGEGVKPRQDYR